MCLLNFTKTLSGSELRNEVNKAISSFTDNFVEFTAHDVTAAVRKAVGPTVEVIHNKVRAIVHDVMAGAFQYEEFLKSFGPAGLQARAYRSTVGGQCVPATGKGTGHVVATGPTIKLPVANISKLAASVATHLMQPKSEGRVTVPASALKKTGLYGVTKSGFVYLREDGNNLVIDDSVGNERYKLDKHGSFRLRSNHVKGFKRFAVHPQNGKLVIVRS